MNKDITQFSAIQCRQSRICLALLLVCMAVYWVQAGDYFFFDSKYALEHNDWLIIDVSEMDDWRVASVSTAAGPLGRPISNLSFVLNGVLDGEMSALSVKRSNALIHGLVGWAVFLFLRLVLSQSPVLQAQRGHASVLALVAAGWWILHPLHVSTVLYGVQRMTQLPALFVMLGLFCFFRVRVRWLQRSPDSEDVSRAGLILFVFTALAALSKENGLLLPWLAAITELCLFRFVIGGHTSTWYRRCSLILLLLPLLGLLLLVAIEPSAIMQPYELRDFSFKERVLTQLRILWVYMSWLALPLPGSLGFYHDYIDWSHSLLEPRIMLALAGWLGVACLAWWQRNSYPLLGFALLWYLLAHSMESSVLALEMTFEHRNYLPAVGVLLLFSQLLFSLCSNTSVSRTAVAAALLLAMTVLLVARSSYWAEELTLAEHHYANHPQSARTRMHLASVYQDAAIDSEDPAQRQVYLAAARELAWRSLQQDENSIEALVLLIHFDGNSSQPQRADKWLARLQEVVGTGSMSVSDINFLEFYNRCVLQHDCKAPPGGQALLLESLARQFSAQPEVWYLLVDYCYQTGDMSCVYREASALREAHPEFQLASEALYHAAVAEADNGKILLSVQAMLEQDRSRRLVRRLRFGGGQ